MFSPLTETQLLPQDSDNEILNNLCPFKLHRQDHNTDKYSSMALCARNTVEIRQCEYFPSINALTFDLVNRRSKEIRTVLLLYRKQNSNILQYVDCLKYMLNSYSIDIILGDFNINYLNDNQVQPLKSLSLVWFFLSSHKCVPILFWTCPMQSNFVTLEHSAFPLSGLSFHSQDSPSTLYDALDSRHALLSPSQTMNLYCRLLSLDRFQIFFAIEHSIDPLEPVWVWVHWSWWPRNHMSNSLESSPRSFFVVAHSIHNFDSKP